MKQGEQYWSLVDPVWDAIDIYEGPIVFLESYGKAPRAAGLLFAAHFCQSEIRNGGFWQFFSNSTGVLAPEAVEGFRAVGQVEVAETIQEAMAALGAEYIRDRKARQERLALVPREALYTLDKRFYELIQTEAGGFAVAADQFAAQYSN